MGIWVEKPARFRSRLMPVIFSEGQNFSATLRREIFEGFVVAVVVEKWL